MRNLRNRNTALPTLGASMLMGTMVMVPATREAASALAALRFCACPEPAPVIADGHASCLACGAALDPETASAHVRGIVSTMREEMARAAASKAV